MDKKFVSLEAVLKNRLAGTEKYEKEISHISVSSDIKQCIIIPGLADVHVHFREPGFVYKETIKSGSMSAAHGGYCAVCSMPNLSPVPDCEENLKPELAAIKKDAVITVLPYGAITKGEKGETLSDMEAMAPYVCAFSDDGKGVQNDEMMRAAMKKASSLGKLIAAHCEDESLLTGGCIHDGEYARKNGFNGISSESEWRQVERDLKLVRETGCAYHVCHVSTKESVALIREAKKEGLNVTFETGPHYLLLDDGCLKDEGRFKMNPPIRSMSDRAALIEALCDGTLDIIATDHAPHSAEEKSKGLKGSAMGIVGLETAFPMLYTQLVKKNIITLERLVELMAINPRKRFGIKNENDFSVFDVSTEFTINPDDFFSKGRATPFEGEVVVGKCLMCVHDGKAVWQDENIKYIG